MKKRLKALEAMSARRFLTSRPVSANDLHNECG